MYSCIAKYEHSEIFKKMQSAQYKIQVKEQSTGYSLELKPNDQIGIWYIKHNNNVQSAMLLQ